MMTTATTTTTTSAAAAAAGKAQDQTPGARLHGALHHRQPHRHKEEEQEEVESEEEADDKDCFFESLDHVPSSVSYVVDLPSDSDEDDDVRISFASAIAPPADFRSVTFSREEFLRQNHDDHDDGADEGGGYDYDVWMAEPASIQERRRRLLQGMDFASNRDLAATLRSRGGSPKAILPPVSAGDARGPEAASPSSPPHHPAVSRCRSDTELATTRRRTSVARAASAPPTLCKHRPRQKPAAAEETGTGGTEEGRGLVVSSGGIFRIKNLDTGKEFVVSEISKDGSRGRLNDPQTGMQITMEEFEQFLGYSPIIKELMRRANLSSSGSEQRSDEKAIKSLSSVKSSKSSSYRKRSWLKNIKFVASSVTARIAEKEKVEAGSKAAGKLSGDNSSELLKVRHHGKSYKELTGLYMSQEIHAHQGSIWSIKFSWDGRYLASAGEDRIVRVWQVQERDILSTPLRRQGEISPFESRPVGSPERSPLLGTQPSKRTKKSKNGKRSLPDFIVMPEIIFSLSEKPVCSFEGHLDDVLDLSWSKSQHLLSSSMDKTVRLWDMESKACLKLFAHNDYVTCIQFNPIDDRYFISGSLDSKVRIWSIPDRQVVDWSDLHEMVTATCYTPDGQGALIGSHKGCCRLYKTSGCKLSQEGRDMRIKKKKSHAKKITGFQFAPGNPSEVMITSADSRVRIFDNLNMVHKFRGFRNTSSQISASYASDGKYIVCASEDAHVYVWKREPTRNILGAAAAAAAGGGSKSKGWTTTRSHEYFYCKDVSVAIPWPTAGSKCSPLSPPPDISGRFNHQQQQQEDPLGCTDSQRSSSSLDDIFHGSRSSGSRRPPLPKKCFAEQMLSEDQLGNISRSVSGIGSESFGSGSSSMRRGAMAPPSPSSSSSSIIADSGPLSSSFSSWGWHSGAGSTRSSSSTDSSNAWGLVVVTAGLGGDIRIYQNFGLPVRLTNLF